jgi:hypothetical protein
VPAIFGDALLPQREAAPGFALLGFGPLQRMRSRGFGPSAPCGAQARLSVRERPLRIARRTHRTRTRVTHTRHRPSSAFRTLSTVYTPRHRPGLFHPGNAPGVPSSGLQVLTGEPYPSRGRLLSCRSLERGRR